ncbi:MAG: hypothetical protein SFX74_06220 [Fimbriimonadaceae bacterium]|nr:hypothetical protein [Fimbriimonadaceae bacterium]
MKLNRLAGLIATLVGVATVAQADYILDAVNVTPPPPPPPPPAPGGRTLASWYFRDVDKKRDGIQIRAWIELENGQLRWKTDSTQDVYGNKLGTVTFSSFGSNVDEYEFAFDDAGAAFARVNGQLVKPNFVHGTTTTATPLTQVTAGSTVSLTTDQDGSTGAGWSFGDADANKPGNQILVLFDYILDGGILRFRTTTTVADGGGDAGTRTINRVGDNRTDVTEVSGAYTDGNALYVVAEIREKGRGKKLVVLTTNFRPRTPAKAILPDF